MKTQDELSSLTSRIAADGFAFMHGGDMRAVLARHGSLADWPAFAASWNDLGLDTYMADGGRYRKRRHVTFAAVAGEPIHRAAHQPHYQSRDYNPLNGGIARWFDPVLPEIGAGASMTTILATCRALFERLLPARAWHIEVHQFRIEARSGVEGRPTPEGMHRDGVDQVLVLLIGRRNIQSGVTSIHDATGRNLGSFTLAETLDAAWVDDHRVMHGVTPVEPIDPTQPGFRDVLVVTFRREDGATM
jgi:hypothetical protein